MAINTTHRVVAQTAVQGKSQDHEPGHDDVRSAARVCESFVLKGMHGLARIQKAASALHETLYANTDVASFRSGMRFTGNVPTGCEKLADVAETLRSHATQLAISAVSSFGQKQQAELISIVAAFAEGVKSSEQGRSAVAAKAGSRLVGRAEEAVTYVQSRPSSVVNLYWPEVVNQLLEDSSLLLHAHQSIADGKTIKVDPHGRFLEPIALASLQATVDRESHVRTLTLARCRAAYSRFKDLAKEWEGGSAVSESPISKSPISNNPISNNPISNNTVSMELLRNTRAAFKAFHDRLESGPAFPYSGAGPSSPGPLGTCSFLSEVHLALLELSLARSRTSPQSRRIVALAEQICEQELSWAEYSNPFHPGLCSKTLRNATAELSRPPQDEKPPSRFTWELRGIGRTTSVPREQRGTGDEPLTSGERNALRNWESLLQYGAKSNDARGHALPKGAAPIHTAQYGGSAATIPTEQRLLEYVEFQKQFLVDPLARGHQCGLGGFFSAEWLATALRKRGKTARSGYTDRRFLNFL